MGLQMSSMVLLGEPDLPAEENKSLPKQQVRTCMQKFFSRKEQSICSLVLQTVLL